MTDFERSTSGVWFGERTNGASNAANYMETLTTEEAHLNGHYAVSSEDTIPAETFDVDQPKFGEVGANREEVSGDGLEPVPGYDATRLRENMPAAVVETHEAAWLDAWYASFPNPTEERLLQLPDVSEVVIGADERVQITNTTAFPWRAICSLRIAAKDGSNYIGTGWFVGPRTVVTAGHCVYLHNHGGWARSIEVIPGRNGNVFPFGSATSSSFCSVTGWTSGKKREFDYGVIQLPGNQALGNRVGWFGYGNFSDATVRSITLNLAGYPGDKPNGTMWYMALRASSVDSHVITYNIDTAGGQSGSPVWYLTNGQRYAVGIHTNGSLRGNSATRINKSVYDNIKAWKQRVE